MIVRCEHGLGDSLMFMRFLPHLRARDLHFLVQPPLVELLRGAPGLGEVRNYWTDDPLPSHEVDLEVMELPYVLRTTLVDLPPPYPCPEERLASFELPDDGRLRVGLLWSVSDWGQARSVPLQALAPLFERVGVQFYSLQQGEAANDPLLDRFDIEKLSPRTSSLGMAGAAIAQMDVVITPDAMAAHLAGMLGRPTWVMLLHDADWRWMVDRDDSPWYPTARLFRQARPGDWEGVAHAMARELRAHTTGLPWRSASAPATSRRPSPPR